MTLLPATRNPADDEPPRVLRVDPEDGAANVFRDVPVVVRLSHPALATSVTAATVTVTDERGPLPADVTVSPDARVLIWRGWKPLAAGVRHEVTVSGVKDKRGRIVRDHCTAFTPCALRFKDFGP